MVLSRPTTRNWLVQRLPMLAAFILAVSIIRNVPLASASVDAQSGGSLYTHPRRQQAAAPRHGTLAFTLTMMGNRRGKAGNLSECLMSAW